MQEQPNYYAILTADVRYDKNLSPMAKLLFAEITALTQKEGYCWASNRYFAELYELSAGRISHLISSLVENKYITVEIVDNTYRKITLAKNSKGVAKNVKPPSQKQQRGVAKNSNIIIQDNIKKNSGSGSLDKPAAKKQDNRGVESAAKEKIRQAIKSGNLRSLKEEF